MIGYFIDILTGMININEKGLNLSFSLFVQLLIYLT